MDPSGSSPSTSQQSPTVTSSSFTAAAAGASSLPILFLFQARLHGAGGGGALGGPVDAAEIISHMGIGISSMERMLNVGMLTCTSGVFVVVGISSYAAYRLYTRLSDVVSSSSDSSPEQNTPRTVVGDDGDRASIGEVERQGFYAVRVGEDDQIHQTLHHLLESHLKERRSRQRSSSVVATNADDRYRVVYDRDGHALRLLNANPIKLAQGTGRSGRRVTDAGVFASVSDALPRPSSRRGVVARECTSRRDHSNESQSSGLSCVTSASRQHRDTPKDTPAVAFRLQPATPTRSPRGRGIADAVGAGRSSRRLMSTGASSTHSASLLLVWDGEEDYYWLDEEWNVRAASSRRSSRDASPAPSGISDLSAVERLEQMFRQAELRDSQQQQGTASGMYRDEDLTSSMSRTTSIRRLDGGESIASGLGGNVHERLYRSVVLDDGRSVASSSMPSSAFPGGSPSRASRVGSNISNRRDIGLWELASPKYRASTLKAPAPLWSPARAEACTTTSSTPSAVAALMTDSAISKESAASSSSKNTRPSPSTAPSHPPSSGAMFDSAIVTDLRSSSSSSSDTEGASEAGSLKSRRKKEGIVRRTWLGRISEKPSPQHRSSAGGNESAGGRVRGRSASFSSSVRSAQLEWD